MTSGRKPAGAPRGWDEQQPAGAPDETAAPGMAPDRRQTRSGPTPGAARAHEPDTAAGPTTEGSPTQPPNADSEQQVQDDLDALLADVKRERDEYLELAQRAKADFENYRKRAAREAEDAERRGRATVVRDLIPVLDNLERALRVAGVDPDTDPAAPGRAAEEAAGSASGDGEGLVHGVRLVHRELRGALERAGVEAYDPAGEKFDPALHEAIATTPADGIESGIIVETAEKGYRLDGQVLRAARVIVSAAPAEGGNGEDG